MSDGRFDCPGCGKAYRWQTKIAGRLVRCVCGQKFRVSMSPTGSPEVEGPLIGAVPSEPPSSSEPTSTPKPPVEAPPEPDPYELDLPGDDPIAQEAASAVGASPSNTFTNNGKCPSCNMPLREGVVICMNCGFNLAEGAMVQTVVDRGGADDAEAGTTDGGEDDSYVTAPALTGEERVAARSRLQDGLAEDMARKHRFQGTVLPLILVGIGFVFLIVNTMVLSPKLATDWGLASANEARVQALINSVLLFLIQIPCLLIGLVLIAKLFGSAFGTLTETLKKLAVLALIGGQFDQFLQLFFAVTLGLGAVFSLIFQVFVSFAVFWIVAKQLFDDLEHNETVGLWLAMLLIPGFVLGAVRVVLFG
ncbi:MAG: hypothetical protein AAGH99_14330 [Planctomycetota bacterium]